MRFFWPPEWGHGPYREKKWVGNEGLPLGNFLQIVPFCFGVEHPISRMLFPPRIGIEGGDNRRLLCKMLSHKTGHKMGFSRVKGTFCASINSGICPKSCHNFAEIISFEASSAAI